MILYFIVNAITYEVCKFWIKLILRQTRTYTENIIIINSRLEEILFNCGQANRRDYAVQLWLSQGSKNGNAKFHR